MDMKMWTGFVWLRIELQHGIIVKELSIFLAMSQLEDKSLAYQKHSA
jgi:hypothetical protein